MEAPVTSTSVQQKIRSKQLAHSRFQSPKVRDLLREKCRIRLRESRKGIFDQQRGGLQSPFTEADRRALISSTIRDELRDLNVDLQTQEEIIAEMSEEAFAWYLRERDEAEEEYVEQLGDDDEAGAFFCPICQKTVLSRVFDHHACQSCGLRFQSPSGQLQYEVLRKLVEHEQSAADCSATPTFFAEPIVGSDFHALNLFCDGCDFYATFRR